MKSILDRSFQYRPSYATDVRQTFERIRREMEAAAQLGRKEQATGYVEALRRRLPFLDLEALGSRFKDPSHRAYLREGLRLAGL